jgi:hypothetical protein
MCAATVERGQQNMAQLEQAVIKDNTLMPGEWYGGQLHLAPPTDQGGDQKAYSIIIIVGSDRHVIEVAQGAAGTCLGAADGLRSMISRQQGTAFTEDPSCSICAVAKASA